MKINALFLILLLSIILTNNAQSQDNQKNTASKDMGQLVEKGRGWAIFASTKGTAFFSGAINDDSVDAIISLLDDISVKKSNLIISSNGGATLSAIKLAKYIHANQLRIHINKACEFVCAYYILPASPKVYFSNDAIVTLRAVPSRRYFELLEAGLNHESTLENLSLTEAKRSEALEAIEKQRQALLPSIEQFYTELGLSTDTLTQITILHRAMKKALRRHKQPKKIVSKAAVIPDKRFLEKCLGYKLANWEGYSQMNLQAHSKEAKIPVVTLTDGNLIYNGEVIAEFKYENCD